MNEFEKWKLLPIWTKAMLKWNKWLLCDMRITGHTGDYEDYHNFRIWLAEYMKKEYGITQDVTPWITESEIIPTWFEVDDLLNKDSLLEIEPDKNYSIKLRYYNGKRKYAAVEVKSG